MFLPSSLCCLFHQSFPSSLSIYPILFTSLHKCSDINHIGYADLPRLHLCRKTLQQANELSFFDYSLIHSRTLRKIQSLKSVFLTSHDSLKTKGCLCGHGPHKDPSALVQSPGCGCRVFSHTFQSHNKINSICPLELPTSQMFFFYIPVTVKYIVGCHVSLCSSDALISL